MLLFNSQSYKRSRERKGEEKTNSHLVSSIVANFVAHVGSVAANEVCIGEYISVGLIDISQVYLVSHGIA